MIPGDEGKPMSILESIDAEGTVTESQVETWLARLPLRHWYNYQVCAQPGVCSRRHLIAEEDVRSLLAEIAQEQDTAESSSGSRTPAFHAGDTGSIPVSATMRQPELTDTKKRKYDSTVARIAGNIIGHMLTREHRGFAGNESWEYAYAPNAQHVQEAVAAARAIVEETIHTEPAQETK